MKNQLFNKIFAVLFSTALLFLFFSCEMLQGLFDPNAQEKNQELEIENSGLLVNKYIKGSINSDECAITLYKNGTFVAVCPIKNPRH